MAELPGDKDTPEHQGRGTRSSPYSVTFLLALYLLVIVFSLLLLAFQFHAVQHGECGPGIQLDGGCGGRKGIEPHWGAASTQSGW